MCMTKPTIRLRSACASAKSNQSLRWSYVLSTVSSLSKRGWKRTIAILGGCTGWSLLVTQFLLYIHTSSTELRSKKISWFDWLIVLGFNDTSTLEGHFVSSPREREKRDRRESRGDEWEGQGRKRNRNESEETEEIKTFPLYPYPLQG